MSDRIFTATGFAIVGFVILVTYSFTQLIQIQRAINTDEGENILWMLNQAEKETRRLHETILELALGQADRDDLLFRLDILHSRMALLSAQPQKSYLTRIGSADDLSRDAGILANLTPNLENATGPEDLGLPAAGNSLMQLADNLGRMANHSMVTDRTEKAVQREQQQQALHIVIMAFAGLLFAGAYLSWLLVNSARMAVRSGRELRRHKEQLEVIVTERTAELRQALETERHAKEVYRGFIMTVSHQFGTPLAIIDLIAQRLARRPEDFPPQDLAEKAKRIRKATQRLTQLVASVTGAVRLGTDAVTLARTGQDLNSILRAAVTYQAELSPDRVIRADFAEMRLDCYCDAFMIEQVILNLLSNAIKYSSNETAIDVHSWRSDDRVFCSVRDKGIGIPETEQARIFSRFYRGSNAASIVGSGLGLNLSRTIIDLHDGQLSFHSEEGQGSVFTFWLPVGMNGTDQ